MTRDDKSPGRLTRGGPIPSVRQSRIPAEILGRKVVVNPELEGDREPLRHGDLRHYRAPVDPRSDG